MATHAKPHKTLIAVAFALVVTHRRPYSNSINRPFTCAVEVEANENKPGWQDAMIVLLIQECVARWDS